MGGYPIYECNISISDYLKLCIHQGYHKNNGHHHVRKSSSGFFCLDGCGIV